MPKQRHKFVLPLHGFNWYVPPGVRRAPPIRNNIPATPMAPEGGWPSYYFRPAEEFTDSYYAPAILEAEQHELFDTLNEINWYHEPVDYAGSAERIRASTRGGGGLVGGGAGGADNKRYTVNFEVVNTK
jgi:hypothetical protein